MLSLTKMTTAVTFNGLLGVRAFHLSPALERARQMTRLRKRKIAVKNKKLKEERLRKNPPPIPKRIRLMLMEKGLWPNPRPLREVDDKPFAADTVYLFKDFTWKRWELEDAVQELRLANHPSMSLNRPKAIIEAKIELDLRAPKKDKYIEEFSKQVPIWHNFDRGVSQSNVMAFCPDEESVKVAEEAGAVKAGLPHLMLEIAKGRVDISDIDYFVAHEDVAQHLNQLVGMLRDKTPKVQTGTIGTDLALLVKTFSSGMLIDVKKPKPTPGIKDEPDYGYCIAPIGTLDMDAQQIGENLDAILEKLDENRPRRKDPTDIKFITRCIVRVQEDSSSEEDRHPSEEFSIMRKRIVDEKGEMQEGEIQKGKEVIERKIEEIRMRLEKAV